MPTYRMDVAYHGAGFHGYAAQPGVRTVQGELEAALRRLADVGATHVAGRTDAGVHASGQVVSFASDDAIDPRRLVRSLNKMLGPEISILDIGLVADDFHARFSALGRQYRYLILNREAPDPFLADVSWHVTAPLDVALMNEAAATVVGEHDFAAFCRRSGTASTVRLVHWTRWRRDGDLVELSIAATSFCHQMVRSIVAMTVEVGRGRRTVEEFSSALAAGDRSTTAGAAPPHGLTLVAVAYHDRPATPPPWTILA